MTSAPNVQLSQPHGLHHLALGARNVEQLAAFYSMAFGLREVSRHRGADGALRSVWLGLEGAVIMIEHTTQRRETAHDTSAGLFLIAFRIDPSERVDFESRLAAHACPVQSRTEHTSYFRDPEGNRFAISSYPLRALG
jgi:glyoxylase I family protein